MENQNYEHPIPVTASQLPLACPQPDAPLWARHPRVYLNVVKTGEAVCPYCSAHYVLSGPPPKDHH